MILFASFGRVDVEMLGMAGVYLDGFEGVAIGGAYLVTGGGGFGSKTLHSPTIPGGFLVHSLSIPKLLEDSLFIPAVPITFPGVLVWFCLVLVHSTSIPTPFLIHSHHSSCVPATFPHLETSDVIHYYDRFFKLSLNRLFA